MNLFWKNLFGQITSTAKFEAMSEELISSMIRYEEVSKSIELEEYNKLFHEVRSAAFIEQKKTLQNRKYKDTEEFGNLKRFNKLDSNAGIQLYYNVLNSVELQKFHLFKSTPEYEDLGDKKKLKDSEKLRNFKHYENSKDYKTYTRFHDSFAIKEYEQLKTLVHSDEFKKRNEFWANPHRWQTTPEYVKEQRFQELAKNPDIIFFINEKPERFDSIRNKKETFHEDFNWNTLAKSRWNFGFHYSNDNLRSHHSFSNEKQANNNGKNISVIDGILHLSTKHEKTKATAWDSTKGFIDKEFEYTSDVANSARDFRQKFGTFSVKLRCSGKTNHAFWLGSDKKLPHINIFHFDGSKVQIGNAGENILDGIEVKGLQTTQFYIYTLIWTEKELIWKINNLEIYRTASNIPKEEMYMVFNSFIPQKDHGGTGLLEIDWIKVYDK